MTQVKICGIRHSRDLATVVASGADAAGFICDASSRSETSLDEIARLVARSPKHLKCVMVTRQTDPPRLLHMLSSTGVQALQIHADIPATTHASLKDHFPLVELITAVPMTGPPQLLRLKRLGELSDQLLIDSPVPGSGVAHDWEVAARVVRALAPRSVWLAGGLSPENVRQAVSQVGPYGVDANSGLNTSAGSKSRHRCVQFVRAAKGVAQ